jgi:hypothetical protein
VPESLPPHVARAGTPTSTGAASVNRCKVRPPELSRHSARRQAGDDATHAAGTPVKDGLASH